MTAAQSGCRVAIVGAGLAGLTAARHLTERGGTVTVFEKSAGFGGRLATRRLDSGAAFDHGAQYFTVSDPGFAALVDHCISLGVAGEWTGAIVKLTRGVVEATEPRPRYVGVPGMSALGRHLAQSLDVRQKVRIVAAERRADRWTLQAEGGASFGDFDVLLVAVPAPQVAELLPADLRGRLPSAPMLPCWAVLATAGEPVPTTWDGAFVHESPLSWVARNSSKPGRPPVPECWVLHGSPAWSQEHLEKAPEEVAALLIAAFAEAVGQPVPDMAAASVHRWRYSLARPPLESAAYVDEAARLVIAGDWLAGGRVEGAYLSGVAAAEHARMLAP